MIDPTTKLTILNDDNAVFTNFSNEAADYLRDDFTVTLDSTNDYLYIGFEKAINSVYVKLTTPNTNANTLVIERFDEDAADWVVIIPTDETNGFTRSGFIYWPRELMAETDVDGNTKTFIRIRPSADHTATTIRGINLVFADDASLKSEFFAIDNAALLPEGETDHINAHVASRNQIIQRLRNDDYVKTNGLDPGFLKADQWDLFDIFEVKQGAVHLALSKIFFNLSDDVDDHWWVKYLDHQRRYDRMLPKARLSFDSNDDGVEDANEVQADILVQTWNR